MAGKIYNKPPEGYSDYDTVIGQLSAAEGQAEQVETRQDGYVYVTFASGKVYKLDYVYVTSSTFEGNVYAVLSQVLK